MPLGDGTKVAGYTIERMLGSGGMGEVYLVQHPMLPRQGALKVFKADISADPAFVERFNREADAAAKLSHRHIVGVHDRGRHGDRLWIATDFVDGTDVDQLLRERYPNGMPAHEAVEIIKAVAAALDYAHACGLVHRDVAPANIVVSEGEQCVMVGGFGVARDVAERGPSYLAPEQLMSLNVDGRTDQYALAVTAYQLLTGAPPFQHAQPVVVIGLQLNAKPPRVADARPELAVFDAALSRALAKDPEARFATCEDFAQALEEAAEGTR